MPAFSFTSLAKEATGGFAHDPTALQLNGAKLPCEIRVHASLAEVSLEAGEPVSAAQWGEILIDTGAEVTCVDKDVLIGLGISPVADCEVFTPQGQGIQGVYPCGLGFPGTGLASIPETFVLGSDLKRQGIQALLGRDILAGAVLVYNGTGGHWVLSF